MLTLLFWNLNRNGPSGKKAQPLPERQDRLAGAAKRLINVHQVDIAIFAESTLDVAGFLRLLNDERRTEFFAPHQGACSHIQMFTRFPDGLLTELRDYSNDRYTIRHLKWPIPHRSDLLLVAAHMPSKRNGEPKQRRLFDRMAQAICDCEDSPEVGNRRTIVIGDLNADPFDIVVSSDLAGASTRSIADKKESLEYDKPYRRLYNPMWTRFGERIAIGDGTFRFRDDIIEIDSRNFRQVPPGTYYYEGCENRHYWHLYDQVLLRPDLLPLFRERDLHILSDVDGEPLLDSAGLPDRLYSDHLPVLVGLDI